MSGKKAKLARKALRAAGYEDKVTRKLRLIKERMEAEERAQKARAEARAKETPAQRVMREKESRMAMRRVALLMSSAVALAGSMSLAEIKPAAPNRTPRNRRGL